MRVGLLGFGKTGQAVANVLLESNHTTLQWVLRKSKKLEHRSVPEFFGIESNEPGLIYSIQEYSAKQLLDKYPVDIIIDFSSPDGLDYYGEEARLRGLTIISAVSQYPQEKQDYIQDLAKEIKILHSPNITLGINFLIIAAKILKNIAPDTDIEIIEEHFKTKPEISGTARKIAQELELPEENIKTIRAGGIIGVHEILFGFPYQTIRLKHESISRNAFGNGIEFAINNIQDKPRGFYKMEDLLIPYFNLNEPEQQIIKENKKPWWKIW